MQIFDAPANIGNMHGWIRWLSDGALVFYLHSRATFFSLI